MAVISDSFYHIDPWNPVPHPVSKKEGQLGKTGHKMSTKRRIPLAILLIYDIISVVITNINFGNFDKIS